MKIGIYKHYKGKEYQVLGTARHSENLEELIIYKALYYSEKFGNNALWVRPKKNFIETIIHQGQKVPRFKFIKK